MKIKSEEKGTEKKKRKKKKMHPFVRGFLGCMVVLVLLLGAASFLAGGFLYGRLNYQEIDSLSSEPFKEEGVKNILLIGNDSRTDDESGRSDAMILVSISSRTNSIHLTSFLRDMYVDIPGHDGNRLNAAYAYGGPELLMETLEENFDIEVNRYMLVNFQAFANLIDAVGGIELDVTNEEVQYINGYLVEYNQQKPVRNIRLDKAVNYVLNRRDTAETYLEDGRCSFTNNLSENAIRPFAVGRKNWLFSNSVEGANASAVVYTMVEMAKAHGLNIYGYLKFLLEHRPGNDMADEQLAELAPWSEKLQSIKNRM